MTNGRGDAERERRGEEESPRPRVSPSPRPPLYFLRRGTALLLACYWIAMFLGTHVPVELDDLPRGSDKAAHFLAYAGLAFLLGALLAATGPMRLRQYLLAAATTAAYGVLDELLQIPVGRHADWRDLLADWAGITLGLATLFVLHRVIGQRLLRW